MQVNCELKSNEAKCFRELIKNAIANRKKIIRFYEKKHNATQQKLKLQKHILKDLKSIKHKTFKRINKPLTRISCTLTDHEAITLNQHFALWINASAGDNGQKLAIALRDKIFEHKE